MSKAFSFLILIVISFGLLLECSESTEKRVESDSGNSKEVTQGAKMSSLPKMLDLGSKSCVPCKKMAPILDSLELLYEGRAEIEFIDVKEDKEALRRYGITLIPTQIFYDSSGKEVYRHIGFFPADSITAHFEKLGVSL